MIAEKGIAYLADQFHQDMLDIYKTAKRECHYNANYFLGMLSDLGGVETAKRLLATAEPSEGFTTLYLCKRLDLTVEAHVIKSEYASLFTPEEIEIARARLKEYGYKLVE